MAQPAKRKVDKSLLQRWGLVGVVLAVAFSAWYLKTTARTYPEKTEWLKNYVKIACPRCNNEAERRDNCSLCNGRGFIWVDKTREDIPDEIQIPSP